MAELDSPRTKKFINAVRTVVDQVRALHAAGNAVLDLSNTEFRGVVPADDTVLKNDNPEVGEITGAQFNAVLGLLSGMRETLDGDAASALLLKTSRNNL